MPKLNGRAQGVHKKFYILENEDSTLGILHAQDKEGVKDFIRENTIYKKASDSLKSLLSVQFMFTDTTNDDLLFCKKELKETNSNKIAYCEIFSNSSTLDSKVNEQIAKAHVLWIVDAVVRLHINAFIEGFTQRDNHAGNILLIQNKYDFQAKFIDLGKARLGFDKSDSYAHNKNEDVLHDLRYLIFQKDHRIGDRIQRGYRDFESSIKKGGIFSSPNKNKKHYPMHKMLNIFDKSGKSAQVFMQSFSDVFDAIDTSLLHKKAYREVIGKYMHAALDSALDQIIPSVFDEDVFEEPKHIFSKIQIKNTLNKNEVSDSCELL